MRKLTLITSVILGIGLSSCAVTDTKQTFDPKTGIITISNHTNSLWTNPTIAGLDIGSNSNGEFHIRIESLTADEVTGLQSFNVAMPKLGGEVAKGIVEGLGISGGNPGAAKALLGNINP